MFQGRRVLFWILGLIIPVAQLQGGLEERMRLELRYLLDVHRATLQGKALP